MDLFAAILVTITVVTICGICLFIFVCALQPKVLRKLHGKTSRTYQDTESNESNENENEDRLSVKSLDLATEPVTQNPSTSPQSNGRDKKAYLKLLERSLRTGQKIQGEEDDDNNENESPSNPFTFICRFMNKHVRRITTGTHGSTEL